MTQEELFATLLTAPSNYIQPVGLDLQTGGRNINLYKEALKNPQSSVAQPAEPKEPKETKSPEYGAPSTQEILQRVNQAELDYQMKMNPILRDRNRQAGLDAIRQSQMQANALLPIVDQYAQRATQRALGASERFAAFKEQLPLNVQRIMESKQGQLASASNAFAADAQAIANQQQAATGFAQSGLGRYAGRRIA